MKPTKVLVVNTYSRDDNNPIRKLKEKHPEFAGPLSSRPQAPASSAVAVEEPNVPLTGWLELTKLQKEMRIMKKDNRVFQSAIIERYDRNQAILEQNRALLLQNQEQV